MLARRAFVSTQPRVHVLWAEFPVEPRVDTQAIGPMMGDDALSGVSTRIKTRQTRRPSRLVAFALAICNSSKVRYSISSSSSCSKVHPKLNYPFLSDALCDMFHPWRREVSLKCVVSIDTSILREQLCAVSTTTLSSSLSPRACWRLLAA